MYKVIIGLGGEAPMELVARAKSADADIAIAGFVLGTKWYAVTSEASKALDDLKLHKIESPACHHAYTSKMKVDEVIVMFAGATEKFLVVEKKTPL